MAKDYSKLSKEELLKAIEKLESRKKYGLIWDEERTKEKFEQDAENAYPVLKEVKGRAIEINPEKPVNLLIEGDNYHALSVLQYTHHEKVDVIYIDPPYNTGAKDWKYNNNYVDKNDQYRHSKWLSMMRKRVVLSRNLLKPAGVFLIAIDDHEIHNIRHVLNDIFSESNYIATICIEVNPAGQNIRDNSPAISHDYCLIYAKDINKVKLILRELSDEESGYFKEEDENGKFLWDNLRRRGGNSTPKDRPGQWFPLYVDYRKTSVSLNKSPNSVEVWPIDPKGVKRIWRVNPAGFQREYDLGNISVINKAGRIEIVKKSYEPEGRKPKTLWKDGRHSATTYGTKLLIDILGENVFTYPKSLYLVEDCIKYWTDQNSVVLDYFAGSGTTGHAVLDLNKQDGGNRQFILCTNNELNGFEKELREQGMSENEIQEYGICKRVTYPRIEKIIKGYKKNGNGENIAGLGGNLRYFKTAFVKKSINRDEIKVRITNECTEMLCVREGIYDLSKETPRYRVFKQGDRIMGVHYALDRSGLSGLKQVFDRFKGDKVLYCFTLDPLGLDQNEFSDWRDVRLEPIPQPILDIYQEIHELGT